jgi:TPR repeat protein
MPAFRSTEVHHIPDLLQRFYTPTPSGGIAKINVRFSPTNTPPTLEDALGVATIVWPFDTVRFPQLSATEQNGYYLQQLRDALIFAADRYGWDTARLDSCCEQIRSDGFKASWWWPTKPKLNPTRRISAQVFIEMAATTRAWVVFRQRSGSEPARMLLTNFGPGATTGVLEYVFGDLSWTNDTTVHVRHANKRDYWAVSTSGEIEFVFPPAESGNAQGLYQLAMLHWEGRYMLEDRKQAIQLMRRSAALGDKHAERFLEKHGQ